MRPLLFSLITFSALIFASLPPSAQAAMNSGSGLMSLADEKPVRKIELNGTMVGGDPRALPAGLMVTFPVLVDDTNKMTAFVRSARLQLLEEASLPESPTTLPRTFWDLGVGANFSHSLGENESVGGNLSVGSPSDRPFASYSEISIQANAIYRKPIDANDSWVFVLNYSNNRTFLNNIPLPGVAYSHQDKGRYGILLGIPFLSGWARLAERYMIFGLVAPWSARVQAGYFFLGPFQVYSSYTWEQDTFFRADRSVASERIFFDEMRAALGIAGPATRSLSFDLSMGRIFDRRIFETDKYSNRTHGELDLDGSYFVTLKSKILF